jgi:ATP-dependent DNA helicase 2 subunit 2
LDTIRAASQTGDWIDALIVGIDMLARHCQKRKYNKRIFLITDGQSKTADIEDLKEVANNLKEAEIKLNVIALNFCNDLQYDLPEERASAAENETPVQQNNKRLLLELTDQIDGRVFPASIAMQIYHHFRKRPVHPIAKFRGPLEISKDLSIQVMSYTKTKVEDLPNLSKYSLVAEECKA